MNALTYGMKRTLPLLAWASLVLLAGEGSILDPATGGRPGADTLGLRPHLREPAGTAVPDGAASNARASAIPGITVPERTVDREGLVVGRKPVMVAPPESC
ncbi:MAG: hypothetical protein ABEJ46_05295, partial [Gemmatimonadota bacterium]